MHSTKLMWIIVSAVAVSALFLTGYGLGTSTLGGEISKQTANYKAGYDAGIEAARQILDESKLLPPAREQLNAVSGNVISIDDGKVVISGAGRISPNPLDPQGPDKRTINITDKTAIKAILPLPPAEIQAAMAKYEENKKSGATTLPSPYAEKIVSADDIKLTMMITVIASGDVSRAETIDAETITFTALPSTVPLSE